MHVTCSDFNGMDCFDCVRKILTLLALCFVNRLYVQDKCWSLIITSDNCYLFLRPTLCLSFWFLIFQFFSFLRSKAMSQTYYVAQAGFEPPLLAGLKAWKTILGLTFFFCHFRKQVLRFANSFVSYPREKLFRMWQYSCSRHFRLSSAL